MPIKLLVWNIQKFSLNTIDWIGIRDQKGLALEGRFMAPLRFAYIHDNVTKLDPDIFVVIEVQSDRGVKGSLLSANSSGGQGCLALLAALKTTNENWRLVPPLKLVPQTVTLAANKNRSLLSGGHAIKKENQFTEVIGVFFRSDRWAFEGPYVWPAGVPVGKSAVPSGDGVQTESYPEPWKTAVGVEGKSGTPNHFAGQFEYFAPRSSQEKDKEIDFPQGDQRSPFTTQFRYLGKPEVLLTLVSVHFPRPQTNLAPQALSKTLGYFGESQFPQTRYPRQENEIVLVVGDFNIDFNTISSRKRKKSASDIPLLENLESATGFAMGCAKNCPLTLLLPTVKTIYSPATLDQYLGPSLDNFAVLPQKIREFMRYKVIDRVMGTQVNKNLSLRSLMFTGPNEMKDIKEPEKQNDVFRKDQNYRHLGPNPGTSDHMALYIELYLELEIP